MLVRILYIGLMVDPPDMSKKGGRGHIAVIGILCSGYFLWGDNFCIFRGQVGSTKYSL